MVKDRKISKGDLRVKKDRSLLFLKSKKTSKGGKIFFEKHRQFKATFSKEYTRRVYIKRVKTQVRVRAQAEPLSLWRADRIPVLVYAMRSTAIIIIVAMNAFGLSTIGTTAAYYFDTETSTDNKYIAGSVDFSLSGTPYNSQELAPGTPLTRMIKVVPEVSSNPFWYHASSTDFEVDPDFCGSLFLKSYLEGVENYSGPLGGFLASATTTLDDWRFDITSDAGLYNKICTFNFDFSGWQTRHNLPEFTSIGFRDTEKEPNRITSRGFRLNKIYYDPSPDRGVDIENEWVEVYNQTNSPIDLAGWTICDGNTCDAIPEALVVPPEGYMLITAATSTENFWSFAETMPVAVIADGSIGDGLDNTNDMVILKRPDGVIIDQMNYGPNIGLNHYSNWPNYNSGYWDPGADDVAQGIALGRNPSGYDTDMPSDWKKLGMPAVNLINPNQSGNQTWTWGSHRKIKWSASNQNGPNTDLSVDLYLIKDLDHSQTITPADSVTPIALGIPNTELYNWQVPSGFLGYIWIKIVVTGPENPMLNSMMTSGKVFDPFPKELWESDPALAVRSINEAFSASVLANYISELIGMSTSTPPIGPVEPPESGVVVSSTTTESEGEPESEGERESIEGEVEEVGEIEITIDPSVELPVENATTTEPTGDPVVEPEEGATISIGEVAGTSTSTDTGVGETTEQEAEPAPEPDPSSGAVFEEEPAVIRDPVFEAEPIEIGPVPEPTPGPQPESQSQSGFQPESQPASQPQSESSSTPTPVAESSPAPAPVVESVPAVPAPEPPSAPSE